MSTEAELREFVRMIARMETDEELNERGSCMENDDAVDTVNDLIHTARELAEDEE